MTRWVKLCWDTDLRELCSLDMALWSGPGSLLVNGMCSQPGSQCLPTAAPAAPPCYSAASRGGVGSQTHVSGCRRRRQEIRGPRSPSVPAARLPQSISGPAFLLGPESSQCSPHRSLLRTDFCVISREASKP